ncbi:hypothetical protein ALC62_03565 [Cyphomyrmex costatus]|uniref:Uncharacterized protein n=1 Tax=Cyphomyrmex costatus TaxID=456900 RepID=A0A151IL45_9HYME|nr:hypothetical protein ALC62_03565 [Cyphomyrmex costatus]
MTLTLIKTISECVTEKMELARVLPFLISNSELSVTDEMNIINNVFLCNIEFCSKSKYLSRSEFINKNLKTNVYSKETWSDILKFEHAVYKALKIFEKCIGNLYTNTPCKYYISMTSTLFLHHIRYFLEYILYRIYLTPKQERSKELYYRKLWHCQRKSIENIAKFTTDLKEQQINNKKMLEDTIKQYKRNIIAINEIDKRCNEYITDIKYLFLNLLLYLHVSQPNKVLHF